MAKDQDKNNDIDLEKMIEDIVSEVFKDFEGIEEEEEEDDSETDKQPVQ